MFELVATKLVHYLLPVFPALAFLAADLLVRWSRRTRRPLVVPAAIGAAMMIFVGILYGFVLPRIDALRISPRVAQVLKREGATHLGDAIMIDYKETSLPFSQGGTIRPQRDNEFLQHTPTSEWPRWIVLTSDVWKQTPSQIKDRFNVIDTIHGWNYADGGRVVDVLVLRKKE
jgi:hypothetical protein